MIKYKRNCPECGKKCDTRIRNDSFGEDFKKRHRIIIKAAMNRPDIKKKLLDHKSKWIRSRTDVGQIEMIDKWNKIGFQLIPNYQINNSVDLFYIDGYDPIHNVVFEYDSKYHMRPKQIGKDLRRQNKIIDILHPKKFWRYNAITKTFNNVMESQKCNASI